ncbi:MAG TPA: DcaP family trimeric outer membrane transporter [Anaeromyxobacter sp.]|nr:DcaP family trimeric outer membrane transporter [Anaeromyxobacter sp.]
MTRSRMLLTLTALVALAVALPGRPDDAQEIEALRAEVKRLSQEVEALKKPAEAPKPAEPTPEAAKVAERLDLLEVKQEDAVVKGDIPGSFRIPGTDVSLHLYGFAELDWVHAFKGDNSDSDYSTFAPYLPLNGSPEAERTNRDYLTVRESRIGLDSGMPTRFGVLSAKFEGDFNNEPRTGGTSQYGDVRNVYTQQATNSYGFRVRHAYGQFGGLLVGQTWSTFMDVDNFPETVDYNGPLGATFIRQPQIRFAYPTLKAGTFTAAIENSSSYVLDETGTAMAVSASRLPDLVVRWDRGFDWGALSARAVTQELRVKGEGIDAQKRGYGVALSGSVKVRSGHDFACAGVTYGKGIGRYLNYIEGAVYDPDANAIHTEEAIGAYAGYQLKVSDLLRFNFAYGIVHELNSDFTREIRNLGLDSGRFGINAFVQQAHAGFFVTPVKAVDIGLEGIWANRRTLAGENGDDLRMNLLARYYVNM